MFAVYFPGSNPVTVIVTFPFLIGVVYSFPFTVAVTFPVASLGSTTFIILFFAETVISGVSLNNSTVTVSLSGRYLLSPVYFMLSV